MSKVVSDITRTRALYGRRDPAHLFTASLLITLAACSNSKPAGTPETLCEASLGNQAVLSELKDQIASAVLLPDDDTISIPSSEIVESINSVGMTISNAYQIGGVEYEEEQLCSAKLDIVLSEDQIAQADKFQISRNQNTIRNIAEAAGLSSFSKFSFSTVIEYQIAPSPVEGEHLIEFTELSGSTEFVANVIRSSLMGSIAEKVQKERDDFALAQAEKRKAAELEQSQLRFEKAQSENRESIDHINQIWSALDTATKYRLRSLQIAWIERKNAACVKQGAGELDQDIEARASILECDTRYQNERAIWLRNFLPYSSSQSGVEGFD